MRRGEARFAASGALVVETGAHTGRSAQDKYTVRDATTEKAVWWDNNKPMSPEQFELLWADFRAHAKSREMFVQDLYAGADPAHRLNARVFVEYAWHALFIRNLLRRPAAAELAGFSPAFTVVNLPSFKADPKRYGVRSRDGHSLQLRQAAGADRRQLLCRRDQEIRLHLSQLRLPREGRDADALLGQCRPQGRFGNLLRPIRHRQDDTVGRSQAHPAGRRRARLVGRRHLQFRGRLLRQDHPPVEGSRARDLGRHQSLRLGAGERDPRSGHSSCPTSTTAVSPRTPAPPTRSSSSPTPARPARPVTPRTSSC